MKYPTLNCDLLKEHFFPIGQEMPRENWDELSVSPWSEENGSAVVHILLKDGEKYAFVVNKSDKRRNKRSGIGLPTKEVRNGELPLDAAERAIRDELNLDALLFSISLNPKPLSVRKNGRKTIHIIFTGTAKFREWRKKIIDSNREVREAIFIDPFSSIHIKTRKKNGRTVTDAMLLGRLVYPSHLGIVALSLQ